MFPNFGSFRESDKAASGSADGAELTLDAIADLHLDNAATGFNFGGNWNLNDVRLKEETQNSELSSLDALASLHLEKSEASAGSGFSFDLDNLGLGFEKKNQTSSGSDFTAKDGNKENFGVKIPSLFETSLASETTLTSITTTVKPSNVDDIDLTSALLGKASLISSSSSVASSIRKSKKVVRENDANLFVESRNIFDELNIMAESRKRQNVSCSVASSQTPSKAGRVVCRMWERRPVAVCVDRRSVKTTPTLLPFKFDSPSPDDVIKMAQSTVFKRS